MNSEELVNFADDNEHSTSSTSSVLRMHSSGGEDREPLIARQRERDQQRASLLRQRRRGDNERNGAQSRNGHHVQSRDLAAVSGSAYDARDAALLEKRGLLNTTSSYVRVALSQTIKQVRKQKVTYCLGFCACFIVVVVVALLSTTIAQAPVVFLRVAESEAGQVDIIFKPSVQGERLNYTLAESMLGDFAPYHAPRYIGTAMAIDVRECPQLHADACWYEDGTPAQNLCSQLYGKTGRETCSTSFNGCLRTHCNATETQADLMLIDLARERHMELGRGWPKDEQLGFGEAIVQHSLAQQIGVDVDQKIFVKLLTSSYFGHQWDQMHLHIENDTAVQRLPRYIYLPYTVKRIFTDAGGKFGDSVKAAILVDYATIGEMVATYASPWVDPEVRERYAAMNLYDKAQQIWVNLDPSERTSVYLDDNTDNIQRTISQFGAAVSYRLGFNALHGELPCTKQLAQRWMFSLLLGLLLDIITAVLIFLSVMLIYSLLSINVETRTFEMGVLRLLGSKRLRVVTMLLCQALAYAVPSVILGLVAAQLAQMFVGIYFALLTGIVASTQLTLRAVLQSSALGIGIPILAAIFPIRNALQRNVNDSLDTYHSKTSAYKVSIERSDQRSFSPPLLIGGTLCAVFGFSIYYLLPYAMLALDLELLLNLFVALLLGMILGLVLLSLNVVYPLQRVLIALFFFWDKAAVRDILRKNLIAHRLRNRKTVVMFAMSVGFIIFLQVSYSLQVREFVYQAQQQAGVNVMAAASGWNGEEERPNQIEHPGIWETQARLDDRIDSFAWISHRLSALPHVDGTRISSYGGGGDAGVNVYAVSPDYFNVTLYDFLDVAAELPHKLGERRGDEPAEATDARALGRMLYAQPRGAVLGSIFAKKMGLSAGDTFLLTIDRGGRGRALVPLRCVALLNASPGFNTHRFQSLRGSEDVIVSFNTFLELSGDEVRSIEDIPLGYFMLRLHGDPEPDDVAFSGAVNLLRFVSAESNSKTRILDLRDQRKMLDTVTIITLVFFGFATLVAMIISFFSLVSSMYINVYEQSKEIGVLRSIGLTRAMMLRVYVYEAFIVVLSSCVNGLFIGTFVGYTMMLQRAVFTQLPIPFVFPWEVFLLIVLFALMFGSLAAYIPVRRLLRLTPVGVLRDSTSK